MVKIKQILVPTDFSEYSDLALKEAVSFAAIHEADIHLVHVMPEMPCNLEEIMRYDPVKLQKDLEEKSEKHFKDQIRHLGDNQGVFIKTKVMNGVPFKKLLKYQKKNNIDLIVISSKGESAIEEVLFGGTSLRIVRYAPCRVMLVKKMKYS